MAQGSKSDITESAENGALRQEIADALGASTDDPQVDHVIDSMAGSAVITEMREAAARALDAAPAAPTTPESGQPAAGPATAVPAAPEDNPYTGLTIGEILSRPWKWNTVEKSPDGLTTTVDHEYIPDPNGPIGTKIETTTKELAGVDAKMVQTTVNAPGQPATIYTQTYRDGELVSSSKQSSDNIFGNQVTDAGRQPAEHPQGWRHSAQRRACRPSTDAGHARRGNPADLRRWGLPVPGIRQRGRHLHVGELCLPRPHVLERDHDWPRRREG